MPQPEADALDRHLGAAIRRFRKDRRLSQHALARRLSLSGQQVQKYESAANRVSASALYRIARELDQPVTAFFPAGPQDGAVERLAASSEMLALAREFADIADPAQRQALLTIAGGLAVRA